LEIKMRISSVLVGLGAIFFLASCGSSVGAYCYKDADCKQCDFTEAACAELARGDEESCVSDRESEVAAWLTGKDGVCRDCVNAKEALWDCMAQVDSCAAFDDADKADGACAAEADEEDRACDGDARAICME